MSIGEGNVTIELGGQEMVLKPSLGAAMAISALGGNRGISEVLQRVVHYDVETVVKVIQAGLGNNARELPDLVYKAGLSVLVPKLVTYITNLTNGGRDMSVAKADEENPTKTDSQ